MIQVKLIKNNIEKILYIKELPAIGEEIGWYEESRLLFTKVERVTHVVDNLDKIKEIQILIKKTI